MAHILYSAITYSILSTGVSPSVWWLSLHSPAVHRASSSSSSPVTTPSGCSTDITAASYWIKLKVLTTCQISPYFTMCQETIHSKLCHPQGYSGPKVIHGSLESPESDHTPNCTSVGSAIFIGLMVVTDREIDRHTHGPLYICNNRPHRCTVCMWCIIIIIDQKRQTTVPCNHGNVYGAIINIKVNARVHSVHFSESWVAANPRTKPIDLDYESAKD